MKTSHPFWKPNGPFNPRALKAVRGFRLMTQVTLSEKTGIDRCRIARLEKTPIGFNPSDEEVDSLAKALDWPKAFFFEDMPEFHNLRICTMPDYAGPKNRFWFMEDPESDFRKSIDQFNKERGFTNEEESSEVSE